MMSTSRIIVHAVNKASTIEIPDLSTIISSVEAVGSIADALSHAHDDIGVGSETHNEHVEKLSEVAARSAASASKTNIAVVQFEARLKDALEGITKRSDDVHDAFMEADHERRVLVKRVMDLEEELASYHPSHPDHYKETTHHTMTSTEDDGMAAPSSGVKGSSLRQPASTFGGLNIAKLSSGKKRGRRHSAIDILKAVRIKKPVGRQGRRPSTIRAHKSIGLFH